jgi:hypothetical protein
MDFADLVRTAGVIKDALRSSSFAGIDVRHDADISHPLNRSGTHKISVPQFFGSSVLQFNRRTEEPRN